jgi:hypothetical protein
MTYVTLSSFYSDDQTRSSVIRKKMDQKNIYLVSCSDGEGNVTSTAFDTLSVAEDFAEDFVVTYE